MRVLGGAGLCLNRGAATIRALSCIGRRCVAPGFRARAGRDQYLLAGARRDRAEL